MKCVKCGLRNATTEVLRRHNNHVEKLYLCDECAKDYESDTVMTGLDMLGAFFGGSPMGLFGNLAGFCDSSSPKRLVCPECKTTSDEFIKTGFVGCPHCYEAFAPIVEQTVKQIQQSDRHVGKVPIGAVDYEAERARLRSELHAAVDRGDYVRTVEINDMLKKLGGEGY